MQKNAYLSKYIWHLWTVGLSLIGCLLFSSIVHAAPLTTVSDTFDNPNVSQGSDHTIVFTSPSGVSAGETILVQFSTAFDISSITVSDVDVMASTTDLDLASTPSGAVWGVSVATNTIQILSGTGTISAGETITIEVGTNATYGAVGSNQVQNPALPGAFSINIAGTFGDTTFMQVFVLQDNSISVSAVVPGAASTSSVSVANNGTIPPPLSGMIFYDVSAIQIDEQRVFVQWRTSLPADAYVVYGSQSPYPNLGQPPRYGYAFQTSLSGRLGTHHGIVVSGLQAGTLYSFRPIVISGTEQSVGPEVQMAPLFRTQTITEIVTEEGEVICEVPEPQIIQETEVVEIPSQCLCDSVEACQGRFGTISQSSEGNSGSSAMPYRDGFVGTAIISSSFPETNALVEESSEQQPSDHSNVPVENEQNALAEDPSQPSITAIAEANEKIEKLEQAAVGLGAASGSFFFLIVGLLGYILRIKKEHSN